MSTALWMLEDGGYEVTILDRAEKLPALDAASTGASVLHYTLEQYSDSSRSQQGRPSGRVPYHQSSWEMYGVDEL